MADQSDSEYFKNLAAKINEEAKLKADEMEAPAPSKLESALRGGEESVSLGLSDELRGALKGSVIGGLKKIVAGDDVSDPQVQAYIKERDIAREEAQKLSEANPMSYLGGQLAGSIIPGIGVTKALPMLTKLAAAKTGIQDINALRLAKEATNLDKAKYLLAEGALTGAIASPGMSKEIGDVPKDVLEGAAIGGVAAPVIAGGVGLVKGAVSNVGKMLKIMSPLEASGDVYSHMRDVGKGVLGKTNLLEKSQVDDIGQKWVQSSSDLVHTVAKIGNQAAIAQGAESRLLADKGIILDLSEAAKKYPEKVAEIQKIIKKVISDREDLLKATNLTPENRSIIAKEVENLKTTLLGQGEEVVTRVKVGVAAPHQDDAYGAAQKKIYEKRLANKAIATELAKQGKLEEAHALETAIFKTAKDEQGNLVVTQTMAKPTAGDNLAEAVLGPEAKEKILFNQGKTQAEAVEKMRQLEANNKNASFDLITNPAKQIEYKKPAFFTPQNKKEVLSKFKKQVDELNAINKQRDTGIRYSLKADLDSVQIMEERHTYDIVKRLKPQALEVVKQVAEEGAPDVDVKSLGVFRPKTSPAPTEIYEDVASTVRPTQGKLSPYDLMNIGRVGLDEEKLGNYEAGKALQKIKIQGQEMLSQELSEQNKNIASALDFLDMLPGDALDTARRATKGDIDLSAISKLVGQTKGAADDKVLSKEYLKRLEEKARAVAVRSPEKGNELLAKLADMKKFAEEERLARLVSTSSMGNIELTGIPKSVFHKLGAFAGLGVGKAERTLTDASNLPGVRQIKEAASGDVARRGFNKVFGQSVDDAGNAIADRSDRRRAAINFMLDQNPAFRKKVKSIVP